VFGDAAIKADEGVLMDGFAPPASAMYSMFPDEQELLQQDWDAYGAVVDTSKIRQTVGESSDAPCERCHLLADLFWSCQWCRLVVCVSVSQLVGVRCCPGTGCESKRVVLAYQE